MVLKRVLVPLDGSMLAELALKPALDLAQDTKGTVYLMRVPVYGDSSAETNPDYDRVWTSDNALPEYETAAEYLRETRSRASLSGVSIRTLVVDGDRALAITNTAAANDIDLIVMSTHARRGVSRLLLGNVAGKVIRQIDTPVLLLRKPLNLRHMLITLDGSELAERVIEPALALAAASGSQITLLQVGTEARTGSGERESATAEHGESAAAAMAYLDAVRARYAHTDLEIDMAWKAGAVAETILSFAAAHEIDLIAMTTHGRSGLRKLVYGSVTEKVLCDSGCAMLIIRPPENTSS